MDTFFRDIHFGVRMLAKNPAFTVVAVISLALGIGANTAVFSVINAVLLRSLPFKDPESLVLVWGDAGHQDRLKGRNQLSATDVADFRSQTNTLEEISTYTNWNPIMSGDSEPERIPAIQVGDGFFKVMRGTPMLGRVFTPEEQEEGKDFVIVLGHALWQRRFNSDPNIVGNRRSVGIEGYQPLANEKMEIDYNTVSAGYFSAMNIPVVEGREFTESDRDGAPCVAVVNLFTGTTSD